MTATPPAPQPSNAHSDSGISATDYEFVQTLLRNEIGFDLGRDRQYLVANRLVPIAAMFDCPDVGQLIRRVRQSQDRRLIEAVAEGMTINETSFFRGGQRLFDNLARVVIPALQRAANALAEFCHLGIGFNRDSKTAGDGHIETNVVAP